MSKQTPPRPTDGELEILKVLWAKGPSTVRQVRETMCRSREIGYTTVLKLLQIMAEKGLVLRDESQRSHVYRARFLEEQTQKQLVRELLAKAFGGSAKQLVMQTLRAKKVSSAELAEIRKFLDQLAEGN